MGDPLFFEIEIPRNFVYHVGKYLIFACASFTARFEIIVDEIGFKIYFISINLKTFLLTCFFVFDIKFLLDCFSLILKTLSCNQLIELAH